MLYVYPKQSYFGKTVPKSKFYKLGTLSATIKAKFVSQIEKIIWSYKLAPETINLASTPAVSEIQIFDIKLKGKEISEELLHAIDKAISFPIIFQLYRGDEVKVKVAYKRPSDADKSKWVLDAYVESEWIPTTTPKESLPVALDLEKLYEQIIKALIPKELPTLRQQGTLKEQIELIETINAKKRAYAKLKLKRDKEKQFNKKVKINEELHKLKKEIEMIKYANDKER